MWICFYEGEFGIKTDIFERKQVYTIYQTI